MPPPEPKSFARDLAASHFDHRGRGPGDWRRLRCASWRRASAPRCSSMTAASCAAATERSPTRCRASPGFTIPSRPTRPPPIIRLFCDEGAGVEIASLGEYRAAQAAGVNPDDILFAGPAKGARELEIVVAGGIGEIHLESFEEIAQADGDRGAPERDSPGLDPRQSGGLGARRRHAHGRQAGAVRFRRGNHRRGRRQSAVRARTRSARRASFRRARRFSRGCAARAMAARHRRRRPGGGNRQATAEDHRSRRRIGHSLFLGRWTTRSGEAVPPDYPRCANS